MVDTSEAQFCIPIPAALYKDKKLCNKAKQQSGC